MSIAIWARKTVALGLAATLAGPSVALLSAQDAQDETQEEKRARRQQQAERQQQKEKERAEEQQRRRAEREEKAARQQEKAQEDQQRRQRERAERADQQERRQAEQQRVRQEQREAQAQRADDQAQRDRERRQRRTEQARIEEEARAAEQARIAQETRAAEQARASQRSQPAPPQVVERARPDGARWRQPVPGGNAVVRQDRVSEARRSEVIRENRERSERFSRGWNERERWGRDRAAELQRQHRYAYSRYHQRYLDRLRAQWRRDDWRRYDYWNDPYYWSAPYYRYRFAGHWYEINDYGADLLREAVNRGYEEGFLAGQADRQDRWRGDYRHSYVYEDATYGYRGLYVDQSQYEYYFRQGFDRGYADGYNAVYRYGYRDQKDHTLKVLAAVLAGILVFEAIN